MKKELGERLFENISKSIWSGKVEKILLENKQFIKDLENFPSFTSEKLSNMSIEERSDFLHGDIIGNTSREFILNVIALKHLSRILKEEEECVLDFFWKPKLDKFLETEK